MYKKKPTLKAFFCQYVSLFIEMNDKLAEIANRY